MFAPKVVIAAIFLTASIDVSAATTCDEWATMTQVLVIRWQNDDQFKGKTLYDVRKELVRQMGGHPEIETALEYVDYAHKNRGVNPQDIWKQTYDMCSATPI